MQWIYLAQQALTSRLYLFVVLGRGLYQNRTSCLVIPTAGSASYPVRRLDAGTGMITDATQILFEIDQLSIHLSSTELTYVFERKQTQGNPTSILQFC